MGNALEATKRDRRREEIKEEFPPESFELPPEIIREILIRLPAKSIGRFRSVSKLFYSLSSDQRFAKSHLDLTIRNDSHRKLIVSSHNLHTLDLDSIADGCDRFRDLVPVELNYPLKDNPSIFNKMVKRYVKDHLYLGRSVMDEDYCRVMNFTPTSYQRNWVEIIGSSHGLVCISPNAVPIFLYNPTTGESKRLPESIPPKSKEYGEDLQTNGFGFDDLTDDYKVLKLTADSDEGLTASLYSLKSDSWRWIRDLNYEDNNGFISGVNLNGAIHWVFTLHEGNNNNQRVVVAFDLRTDEFREMSLPDEVEDCQHRFKNFVVGNLNGRLCLVNSYYEVHDDIWVMNEYGVASSWSRIRISFLYRSMKPLCSIKNSEEVLLELDGHMVLCNFETGASRIVGIRGVNLSGGFEADTYVESLVSPNSYGLEN